MGLFLLLRVLLQLPVYWANPCPDVWIAHFAGFKFITIKISWTVSNGKSFWRNRILECSLSVYILFSSSISKTLCRCLCFAVNLFPSPISVLLGLSAFNYTLCQCQQIVVRDRVLFLQGLIQTPKEFLPHTAITANSAYLCPVFLVPTSPPPSHPVPSNLCCILSLTYLLLLLLAVAHFLPHQHI